MKALQFSGSRLRWAIMMAALIVGTVMFQAPLQAKDGTSGQTKKSTKAAKVDINSADKSTLETLPGIGPTMAQNIIDGRPYRNAADLQKVSGMTKSKLNALKKDITFGHTAMAENKSSTRASRKKKSTESEETATTSEPSRESTGTAGTVEKSSRASQAPTPTGSESGKLGAGEQININTASAGDLERLPGIGPARSQAIVEYRTQNGPFKSPEDIMNVKGIKSGEFSKIKDHIKVSD
ncbi:MAG TPA: helix-hairpin-helix domain-containing protein [Verrucomicrobiae bacterium]|nr:helix-hairpin-helix domain-containing protein [Verrucomicrobiae bacterium]